MTDKVTYLQDGGIDFDKVIVATTYPPSDARNIIMDYGILCKYFLFWHNMEDEE